MLQEKSCGAVVFIRKPELRFLLLHYEEGHWGFVKGHVEFNETEKETVLRELKEETGIINIKFIEGFRETITYTYNLKGKSVHKEVVFFLIETQTKEIKLSYEHSDYVWLSFIKGIKFLTFNNSKNILKKANSFLKMNKNISSDFNLL